MKPSLIKHLPGKSIFASLAICACIFLLSSSMSAQRLNISLDKNDLNLNAGDSIVCKFYLPSSMETTIKFINIYGGEEIIVESNHERSRGWHEIMLHSDSLKAKSGNLSSGVYYLEFTGQDDGETLFEFNSFRGPWGNVVAAKNVSFDAENGQISYAINENCITKTRIGFPIGALVKTLSYGIPRAVGDYTEYWEGYDQSGKFDMRALEGLTAQVIAYSLPKTAFILTNNNAPLDFDSDPLFPDNYKRFALSSHAKNSWKEDFDMVLDYNVSLLEDNMLFLEIGEQNNTFNQSFSMDNEIYIFIEGTQPVETLNVAVPGEYSIAYDLIPKGEHIVLLNLILPFNKIAVGVKKLIIE